MKPFRLDCYFFSQHWHRYDDLFMLLSADERDRAARLKFDDARRRFVIGRGLLRTHLADLLTMPPESVQFRYSEHGKPDLDHDTDLRFSVAHSADLLLIATARGRAIGVDVEHLRPVPQMTSLAQSYFTPDEQKCLEHLTGDAQTGYFFRCWTAREAYVKVSGEGFRSGAFPHISVPPDAANPYHLQHRDGTPLEGHALETFIPAEGYIATVCIEA